MLEIALDQVGKRFVKEWIIRGCDYRLESGKSYAITGPNGSGKSTLAQIISGFSTPTHGQVNYQLNGEQVAIEDIHQLLVFAAPYADLIDEFTLEEMLNFHFSMKKPRAGLSVPEILKLMNLEKALQKEIRNFSSGMRQRLKLALAFTTASELIILDEPTTNLDENGVTWYLETLNKFCLDKLLIISSNQRREYEFCDETIDLMRLKQPTSA